MFDVRCARNGREGDGEGERRRYVYIYMYIEGKRERERDGARESKRLHPAARPARTGESAVKNSAMAGDDYDNPLAPGGGAVDYFFGF
mmetsp:Transcript_38238/g.114451  ORF Transcript_38238/g.114451 Transcript_38238/m.114451 type:complete len:88 (+) Transcript_38238:359-622(+)